MNKYLIDTSSLLILTRYFNPFDKTFFHDWLKKMFISNDFLLLDSVKNECKKVSKGAVLSEYSFLDSNEMKKKTLKSEENISRKIHNKIDNNWVANNHKLNENEYDGVKNKFITSADCQLIICALRHNDCSSNYIVITEESSHSNDNKLFKKLPLICKNEQIQCVNITEVLKRFIKIDFHIINLT